MDDTLDSEGNHDLDSAYYENEINKDLLNKRKVTIFKYPLDATSIVISSTHNLPGRKLSFDDIDHQYKALLWRVIVAAYNYAFTDEFAPVSAKNLFSIASSKFVEWLNNARFDNPYSVLKDYEAYRFDMQNNHGGRSALHELKLLFTHAIERSTGFYESLTPEEFIYLLELKKTTISPNLNIKQISLASYFGALEWLRSEDDGVGNQCYQMLASPKFAIESLKLTASQVIIELYTAKSVLRLFIQQSGLTACDFDASDFKSKSQNERIVFVGQCMYRLLGKYHEQNDKSAPLRQALELVLLSNVTNQANFEKVCPALDSKEQFASIFSSRSGPFSKYFASRTFRVVLEGNMLSFTALKQSAAGSQPLPICQLERLMFSWLMASMAVQPSDIQKLSKQSFRLLTVGQRVTHIECEYFKGRANTIHNTRTVSTRKQEGRALLLYLKQHRENALGSFDGDSPFINNGIASITGTLNAVLNLSFMSDKLVSVHRRRGLTPSIMPLVLRELISGGVNTKNVGGSRKKVKIDKSRALVSVSEKPCNNALFGLQAIKNTAVHASSDPYTLHYLINRNSHTNQTEKLHYLNTDNEEWMNAAGRITRSVMLDLINNVFDLDFNGASDKETNKSKAAFNSEFANVTNVISHKSGEMLSRLKVVTEQGKGVINEVGVLSLYGQEEYTFSPIYVLDSQVTAFKMFNYLHEFKKNYKKLLSRNPDYLYHTALPTAEWVEHALSSLSKPSIRNGKHLFNQMYNSGGSVSVFHSI